MYFIDNELQLVEDRKEHPELFNVEVKSERQLQWTGDTIECCELLNALVASEVISGQNGQKLAFSDIVKSFEEFFNIKLGSSREVKRKIIGRKKLSTIFLDRLRQNLILVTKK